MEWLIGIGWFVSLWIVFELGKEVGFHRGIQAFASVYRPLESTKFIDSLIEGEEEEEWRDE